MKKFLTINYSVTFFIANNNDNYPLNGKTLYMLYIYFHKQMFDTQYSFN